MDARQDMYQQWADAFRSIGRYHISLDKCCKILAIIYANGGNEAFCFSQRFVTDWKTAQQRLYIYGAAEIPNDKIDEVASGRGLLRAYIRELESSEEAGKPLRETLPDWAVEVYKEYSLPIIG